MNDALELIKSRRSTKKFKSDMIPFEAVQKICEAGTYAPTGQGKQSPIIIAVTNKEVRDQLSAINARSMGKEGADPFYGAPVVCVVLADKNRSTAIYDGSCVMENMLLEAASLGIGCCWIHRAKEEFESEEGKALLKQLGIEGEYVGVGNCVLGYSDMTPVCAERKENYVYYVK